MDELRLNLIGPVAVYLGDRPLTSFRTNTAKALLIYLATEAAFADSWPVHFRREQLADLLWPGVTQKSAQDSFRQALYQLRKAIPPTSNGGQGVPQPFVNSDRHTLWIERDAGLHSDVAQLRVLARRRDEEASFQACQLFRGQFLDSFATPSSLEYDIWVANRRDDVHRLMAGCLRTAAALQLARHDYPKAEQAVRQLMAMDPFDEEAAVQLIQIQLAAGSRSAALTTYDQFCAALREGLDAAPGQELQELAYHARHTYRRQPSGLTRLPPPTPEDRPAGLAPSAVAVSHFVGRGTELARLASHLRLAVNGQSQLAFIVGDTGDGKSALAQEFSRRAQQAQPDLVILKAACSSLTGSGAAGLPLGELLGQLLDTSAGWPNAGRQRELIQRLRPVVDQFLSREGYPLVAQFNLAHLLGLPAVPAGGLTPSGPQRVCRPLSELLETVSSQAPLLLLLEDLHWADELTIETLFYVCRHFSRGRLFILGTYRETEVSGSPHPQHALTAAALEEIKRRCGDVCIDLSDQPEVRMRALMDAQIDREPNSLDQEFRGRLFALTRGKPLYVNELIEDLRRQGRYVWSRGESWELVRPARWQPLPAAVAAVLARQFARLDDELRLYLTIAAVYRGPFTSHMIAAAAGSDPAHVASRLAQEIAGGQPLIRLDAERLYQGKMTWHYQFLNDLQPLYLRQLIPPSERRMLLAQGRAAVEGAEADDGSSSSLGYYFPMDQGDFDHPTLSGPAAK